MAPNLSKCSSCFNPWETLIALVWKQLSRDAYPCIYNYLLKSVIDDPKRMSETIHVYYPPPSDSHMKLAIPLDYRMVTLLTKCNE